MRRRAIVQRWRALSPPAAGITAAVGLLAVAAGLAVLYLWISGALESPPTVEPARVVEAATGDPADDPFAWSPERRSELERRATLGYSHVLYEKSPGGVLATARRVDAFRGEIERAAAEHHVDPDVMEAIVFLESAGLPEVIAGDDPAAASGLAQIVASTGIDLLGMRIDLDRSRALTTAIGVAAQRAERLRARAPAAGKPHKVAAAFREARRLRQKELRLRAKRRRIDPRFDPASALDGMARYLEIARARFGADDLAVVSYHMGIGNLENVIGRYVGPGETGGPIADVITANDLSYAQIFFDSSPLSNARAWDLLAAFGDDSSTYYWRVLAAAQIMRTWRQDPGRLRELASLYTAKSTAEEVFHPASETKIYDEPGDLSAAIDDGNLVRLPSGDRYGFVVGKQLGELTGQLGLDRSLYRALRPEALATLIYLGARVREIDGGEGTLTVTSAVRDRGYQDALVARNTEATPEYSLHTTGWSFDVLRRYDSKAQAEAFQFVLDRLRALAVLDYAYEPEAIHITVSDLAAPLVGE